MLLSVKSQGIACLEHSDFPAGFKNTCETKRKKTKTHTKNRSTPDERLESEKPHLSPVPEVACDSDRFGVEREHVGYLPSHLCALALQHQTSLPAARSLISISICKCPDFGISAGSLLMLHVWAYQDEVPTLLRCLTVECILFVPVNSTKVGKHEQRGRILLRITDAFKKQYLNCVSFNNIFVMCYVFVYAKFLVQSFILYTYYKIATF